LVKLQHQFILSIYIQFCGYINIDKYIARSIVNIARITNV